MYRGRVGEESAVVGWTSATRHVRSCAKRRRYPYFRSIMCEKKLNDKVPASAKSQLRLQHV